MEFETRINEIAKGIELGMGCGLVVGQDKANDGGRFFFQIECWRKDVVTGEMGWGYGGKAYLSEYATDSELVQTAFGLFKGYWEHEARENFWWHGRQVFGPHIAIDALWEVAQRTDARKPVDA